MAALSLAKLDYSDLGNFDTNKQAYFLLLISAIYSFNIYFRNRKLK